MGRLFKKYQAGLLPRYEFLGDKAVIVQAWKKAHEYMRRHNWYSDNFELDLSCIDLEDLCFDIQSCFPSDGTARYSPSSMRVVPAPKSNNGWHLGESDVSVPDNFGLRPLAHLTVKDQVVAMMFLMCLANIIENRQGPAKEYSPSKKRDIAVSYGNRLLCGEPNEPDDNGECIDGGDSQRDMSFYWGNSETYNRYYTDYRAFISRPGAVLKSLVDNDDIQRYDLYTLSLDLSRFYDRIDRTELVQKVRREVLAANALDERFLDAFSGLLKWKWDENDMGFLSVYQKDLDRSCDYKSNWIGGATGLPQGLAASGFFANIYLLDLDDCLKRIVDDERPVTAGAHHVRIFDYCRYVDDMRLVVGIEKGEVLCDADKVSFEKELQIILTNTSPGLIFEKKKIDWSPFIRDERIDFVELRMVESKNRTSDALDEGNAYELLKLNHDLWREAVAARSGGDVGRLTKIGSIQLTRNRTGIKADTVERFAANNWRRAYNVLSSILPASDSASATDEIKGEFPLAVLDALTDEFCEEIILRWLKDPSKVRVLRIAFDLRPNASYLKEVLITLLGMLKADESARLSGLYVAAELFRAGAIETGFSYADVDSPRHEEWKAYRKTLHDFVPSFSTADTPWYLANQMALFEFTYEQGQYLSDFSCIKNCDPEYRECHAILTGTRLVERQNFSISIFLLACYMSDPVRLCLHNRVFLSRLRQEAGGSWCKCLAFIPSDALRNVFGNHVRFVNHRSLVRLQDNAQYSLRDIALMDSNPFTNEVAVARLGIELTNFFKTHAVTLKSFYTTASLRVSCSNWKELSNAQNNSLHLEVRESLVSKDGDIEYFFRPEPWEQGDFRKSAQIGRILRAMVMSGDEYSMMRCGSLTVNKERGARECKRFFGVRSSWLKRRYGLYFDRTCLGGIHVAFSPWFTELLSSILAWPGSYCSSRYNKLTFRNLGAVFAERLADLARFQKVNSDTLLIPVDIDIGKFKKGTAAEQGVINIAVVQGLRPDVATLKSRKKRESFEAHRMARRHLSDLISMLRVTFGTHNRLMKTHDSINLIVFPELAVYERDLGFLRRFADKMNCMIFCGLVYCRDPRRQTGIVNAGVWIIPQRRNNEERRVFIELLQGKGNLSNVEVGQSCLSGYRPVQWIVRGTRSSKRGRRVQKLWSLSASICYDATDIRLAAALRDHVDCYVISAFNRDVGLFDVMAESWRYHMYGHMVVANTGIYGGSTIQAPYDKPYERIIAHAHGGNQAQILLAQLNLNDFSSESRKIDNENPKSKKPNADVRNVKASPAGYQGRNR